MTKSHPDTFKLVGTSLKRTADTAGVATEQIIDWIREGKLERAAAGKNRFKYDLLTAIRLGERQRVERENAKVVKKLKARLSQLTDGDGEVTDPLEAAKIAKLQLDVEQKKHHLAQLKNDLIPRVHVGQFMTMQAGHLRNAGDTLARQFGEDAQDVLNQALDATEASLKGMWHAVDCDPRHPKNSKYQGTNENEIKRNGKTTSGSTVTNQS